ncbi:hypothetical protein ABPG74_021910 [Tetrahymena malaccensis]
MSESLIKASKVKLDIEKQISDLDSSKAYIVYHSDKEFLNLFEQSKKRLENDTQIIIKQIEELQNSISQIQIQIQNDYNMSTESKQIQKKKAQNIEGQVRELTNYLRRISVKKMDALKSEKDKYYLYGNSKLSQIENNTINLQLQNKEQITQNSRLTNKMIDEGVLILQQFKNQSQSLKSIQKKVINIVSELGISNQVVRMIGQRSSTDNIIICVLFVVLMIFIAICYYVIRPMVKGYSE